MKIALYDSDKTGFPNLALMKISSYYKNTCDDVRWFNPLIWPGELRYASKVFCKENVDDMYLPDDTVMGGTGWNQLVLDDVIEHSCPDYSLYGIDYSMGFLTRGCIKKCGWCIVPEKEGELRKGSPLEEFVRHDKAVFLDNNILASYYGVTQLEKLSQMNIKVDFNQGLDVDFIDSDMAKLLSALKWLSPIRLACDTTKKIESVVRAITLLRWHNATPRRYFCYVLVTDDIENALERVRILKGMDIDCFAQPYMDKYGNTTSNKAKQFARWVNHKAIFKSTTWEEYSQEKWRER